MMTMMMIVIFYIIYHYYLNHNQNLLNNHYHHNVNVFFLHYDLLMHMHVHYYTMYYLIHIYYYHLSLYVIYKIHSFLSIPSVKYINKSIKKHNKSYLLFVLFVFKSLHNSYISKGVPLRFNTYFQGGTLTFSLFFFFFSKNTFLFLARFVRGYPYVLTHISKGVPLCSYVVFLYFSYFVLYVFVVIYLPLFYFLISPFMH